MMGARAVLLRGLVEDVLMRLMEVMLTSLLCIAHRFCMTEHAQNPGQRSMHSPPTYARRLLPTYCMIVIQLTKQYAVYRSMRH